MLLSRRELSKQEFGLLRQILQMTENQLLRALGKTLETYYPKENLYVTKDYIYAVGDIPIALLSHLDTVHPVPPMNFFHDREKGCIWTPDGLGADDRAGVFSILMLLKAGYRPSVIFLTQEERGGIGATEFLKDWRHPKTDLNFLIELDRQGDNDAVYYECGNAAFEAYISSFDFVTDYGSFSDISIIAPAWDLAAVNLSVGYYDEHTRHEHLYYGYTFNTIRKVKEILEDTSVTTPFKFERLPYILDDYIITSRTKGSRSLCDNCEQWFPNDSLTLALDEDTMDIYKLCPECTGRFVYFCDRCGKAFINIRHEGPANLCKSCIIEEKHAISKDYPTRN